MKDAEIPPLAVPPLAVPHRSAVTDPFGVAAAAPIAVAAREAVAVGDISLSVAELNTRFERSQPPDVVNWAIDTFGNDLVMSSSFGAESATLIHMAIQRVPNIRIIMVDTGYLFPETHQFMTTLRLRFNLNVWTYRTTQDPIHYLQQAGEDNPAERRDINACCGINKNEPFERAMREVAPKAWLRGIRRQQADTRKNREFVEWSRRFNCWAISPLLKMTSKDIFNYMKQHDLPYHPLYEKGYLSIGCNPLTCTRPVSADDDGRSGRWSGSGKIECGINVDDSLDSSNL